MVSPASPYKAAAVQHSAAAPWNAHHDIGATSGSQAPICKHYLLGRCTFGNNCRNRHVKEPDGQNKPMFGELNDIKNWRETSGGGTQLPFQMSNLAKNDNSFMSGHGPSNTDTDATMKSDPIQNQIDFAVNLPKSTVPNKIPVNAGNYRLDPYIPPVSTQGECTPAEQPARYGCVHGCESLADLSGLSKTLC
jgi:hypothetical protein